MSSNTRSSKSRKVPTREQLDEEYNSMTNSCSQELTDILSDIFLESYLGDRHKQVSSLWTLKGKTNLPVYNPRQVLPSLQVMSRLSDYTEVISDRIGPNTYRSTAFFYWQVLQHFGSASEHHENYCNHTEEGFRSLFLDSDGDDVDNIVRHLNKDFTSLVRVCFAPEVVKKLIYFDKNFVDRTLIPRVIAEGKVSSAATQPLNFEPIFQKALAGDFTLLVDYYRAQSYSESHVIDNIQLNFARAGAPPKVMKEVGVEAQKYADSDNTADDFDKLVSFMEKQWTEMRARTKRDSKSGQTKSQAEAPKRDFPTKRKWPGHKNDQNSERSKTFKKNKFRSAKPKDQNSSPPAPVAPIQEIATHESVYSFESMKQACLNRSFLWDSGSSAHIVTAHRGVDSHADSRVHQEIKSKLRSNQVMVTQFFKSTVSAIETAQPVTFTAASNGTSAENASAQENATSAATSLPDIIAAAAPEFTQGAAFYVNPLLSSGHAQTAYTALSKFETVDQVYYKRRLVSVQSDKHFYHVGGDKMPYDRWHGQSTFAVDYVVPPYDEGDTAHLAFRPESQKHPLPPRTQYVDPQHEHALLDNDKPLVVALHGLAGGSYESYLRAFVSRATEKYGFDGLVLNARGCANHTITSPQLFCGLWTNDLRYLINEHVTRLWPSKRVFLIGFSLGGSIIANYLGQEGADVSRNIKAAAIMGSPWDFPQASTALMDSYLGSSVYSPKMCQNLLGLLDQHFEGLEANEVIARYKQNPAAVKLHTLRDFDDAFTSALFGFNCASEYYRHASPDQRLLNVRVPTIIVSSMDDPIVGSKSLPRSEVRLNPYTHMVVTSIGGHLGWFDLRNSRWYSDPMARVFAELDRYQVSHLPEADLPRASNGNWAHDRLVQ